MLKIKLMLNLFSVFWRRILRAKFLVFLLAITMLGCSASPESLGISEQQWNKYSEQEQKKIIHDHNYIEETAKKSTFTTPGNSCLTLKIQNGEAFMPPFSEAYAFEPATLKISEGTCRSVELNAVNGEKSVILGACYNDKILLLDPSLYEIDKRYGSARIYYSLLWDEGFNYTNINTDGYAHLRKTTIFITKQNLSPEKCK